MVCGADLVDEEFAQFEGIRNQILKATNLTGGIHHELPFQTALRIARILSLSKTELYFERDAALVCTEPFDPRDCALALSKIVELVATWPAAIAEEWRNAIVDHVYRNVPWQKYYDRKLPTHRMDLPVTSWASGQGILINVAQPALCYTLDCDGGIQNEDSSRRGLAAAVDVAPGDVLVEVPESSLIWQCTAERSELGKKLMTIPGMTPEFLLIMWTMVDSVNESSEFVKFWGSLPRELQTGLTFSKKMMFFLEGTPLHYPASQAQEHLHAQYDGIKPLLDAALDRFPESCTAHAVSKQRFLWASQLWFSYGMQVQLSNGKVVNCLVPYACMFNHSPWPHCVQYGKVDPHSKKLKFTSFRPASAGSELFLSYGPLPNTQLLLFYGFAIKGNHFDILPLDIQMWDDDDEDGDRDSNIREMLFFKWGICEDGHMLRMGSISSDLLAYLRVMMAEGDELIRLKEGSDPREERSCPVADRSAWQALLSVLQEMQMSLPIISPKHLRSAPEADKKLLSHVQVYLQGLHDIVAINVEQCMRMCGGDISSEVDEL